MDNPRKFLTVVGAGGVRPPDIIIFAVGKTRTIVYLV